MNPQCATQRIMGLVCWRLLIEDPGHRCIYLRLDPVDLFLQAEFYEMDATEANPQEGGGITEAVRPLHILL